MSVTSPNWSHITLTHPIFEYLNMGTLGRNCQKCPYSGDRKWDFKCPNPKTGTTCSRQHPPQMVEETFCFIFSCVYHFLHHLSCCSLSKKMKCNSRGNFWSLNSRCPGELWKPQKFPLIWSNVRFEPHRRQPCPWWHSITNSSFDNLNFLERVKCLILYYTLFYLLP